MCFVGDRGVHGVREGPTRSKVEGARPSRSLQSATTRKVHHEARGIREATAHGGRGLVDNFTVALDRRSARSEHLAQIFKTRLIHALDRLDRVGLGGVLRLGLRSTIRPWKCRPCCRSRRISAA